MKNRCKLFYHEQKNSTAVAFKVKIPISFLRFTANTTLYSVYVPKTQESSSITALFVKTFLLNCIPQLKVILKLKLCIVKYYQGFLFNVVNVITKQETNTLL